MTTSETAFLFDCEGDELVGLISAPVGEIAGIGVLVVVGGPQYRVGSHRQFVLLARYLAAAGIPCMRFDYRGMGDGAGEQRDFENIGADVRAAVDAFCERMPAVTRVVLWGLCDGATASCFHAPHDPRVAGLMLLNPWVKTAAGEARTYLKHYYLRRLVDPGFWKKLFAGKVSVGRSLDGVVKAARTANGKDTGGSAQLSAAEGELPQRMAAALLRARKPFRVVLSGRDYIAREFEQAVAVGGPWEKLPRARNPVRLEDADHTFSSAAWRMAVARATADWAGRLGQGEEGRER